MTFIESLRGLGNVISEQRMKKKFYLVFSPKGILKCLLSHCPNIGYDSHLFACMFVMSNSVYSYGL